MKARQQNQSCKIKRDFLDKYSTQDYFVVKDNVAESLDLLAVCRKWSVCQRCLRMFEATGDEKWKVPDNTRDQNI